MLLTVEHHTGACLEDVRVLTQQTRVLADLRAAPARHQHDLDPGTQTRLHRTHAIEADRTVAAVQQRGAAAEQGAVEIDVGAAHAQTLASGGRSSGAPPTPCRRPSCSRRRAIVASTVLAI